MSAGHLVGSCLVMSVAIGAGAWQAVAAFPLRPIPDSQELRTTAGPLETSARPITPENPIPRRTHLIEPSTPVELAPEARATVTVRLTLDQAGAVAEARVSGVSYTSPGLSFSYRSQSNRSELDRWLGQTRSTAIAQSGAGPAVSAVPAVLDHLFRASIAAALQWQYDPPANPPIAFEATFTFTGGEPAARSYAPPMVPPSPAVPAPPGENALRVGGSIGPPRKVKDVRPVYPADAREARVQGIVILEVRVEPDGRVGDARIVRSIPLLDQAAVDAVKQWEFTPTLLNGTAVPVIMTVTVNFLLN